MAILSRQAFKRDSKKKQSTIGNRRLVLLPASSSSNSSRLPGEEEGDRQVVEDVDDDVVVGDGVDLRPRELAVDQYPLHSQSHPIHAAISGCRAEPR